MRILAPPRAFARKRLLPALLALALAIQLAPVPVATAADAATLKVYHADFHSRLSAKVLATVTTPGAARLRMSVRNASGATVRALADIPSPTVADAHVATLDVQSLPAGSYSLVSEVLDANGAVLVSKSEPFTRQISGAPTVGFDADNAMYVRGEPFFPVTGYFGQFPGLANDKAAGKLNSTEVEEYNMTERYDGTTFASFLDRCASADVMAIGPTRSDPVTTDLAPIVRAGKDKSHLLAWAWMDEPEYYMGQTIYAPEIRRWTDVTHANDPNHPVGFNTSGWLFANSGEYNNMVAKRFTLDPLEAGQFPVDWYSTDFYPVGFRQRLGLTTQQAFDAFAEQFVNLRKWTKDLVWFKTFIEVVAMNPGDPMPTGEQVWAEVWIAIANGAKGISWFPFYGSMAADVPAVQAKVGQYTKHFTPQLMQPDSKKVTSATLSGTGRVDFTAKEYGGKLYVFAVNRDVSSSAQVRFDVSQLAAQAVNVYGENRSVSVTNNGFTDTFAPYAVHIYEISTASSGPAGTMTLNNGAPTTTSTSVPLVSAVTGALDMRIDPGTGTFGAWQPYTANTSVAIGSTPGIKTIRVEYRNSPGATLLLTGQVELVAAQTPAPTGTMQIDAGSEWATSGSVTIDSNVTGAAQMRFDTGTGYGTWRTFASSASVTLPSGDGVKQVTAQYRSGDSQILTLTDSIKLDTTAPEGSFSVFDDGTQLAIKSSVTGAATMCFSAGYGFSDWVAYSSIGVAPRPAPARGFATVYAKYRDEAGNVLTLTRKVKLRRTR